MPDSVKPNFDNKQWLIKLEIDGGWYRHNGKLPPTITEHVSILHNTMTGYCGFSKEYVDSVGDPEIARDQLRSAMPMIIFTQGGYDAFPELPEVPDPKYTSPEYLLWHT